MTFGGRNTAVAEATKRVNTEGSISFVSQTLTVVSCLTEI
jgi:hypothetical protein